MRLLAARARPPPRPRAAAASADDAAAPSPPASLVEIGTFGAPHGVRGELRVFPSTDDPAARLSRGGERWVTPPPAARFLGRPPPPPRPVTLTTARAVTSRGRDLWLVGLDGVGDVESAAAFTNHVLWIDAAERPPLPADGDEWYVQDLVGAVAADAQGREVGEIVDVIVGGGGGGADLIRIALPPDPTDDDPSSILEPATVLLPFTKEFVPSVDAAGGRVVVAPPDGYLDAATKPRRAVGATGGKSLRPRKTRKARDAGARSQKAGGE